MVSYGGGAPPVETPATTVVTTPRERGIEMIFPMTLHPVTVRSVLARVPWGEECVADSLVGVVEAGVWRDDPNTCLFQLLCDLLQASRVEAEPVDAGHHELIDPFGSWCRVEKSTKVTAVRRPIVDVSDDLASGGEGNPFTLGPLRPAFLG
jgi:hypothetical protein